MGKWLFLAICRMVCQSCSCSLAKNNHFPIALIHNLKHCMTQERKQLPSPSPTQPTQPTKSKKWATFTFSSPQIRKVTNLLKKTGIKIVFRSNNTLAHLIETTTKTKTPSHNRPGIYQLKCHTCNHLYVGQTNHNLKTRCYIHLTHLIAVLYLQVLLTIYAFPLDRY